jgi:hypothetical protein
MMMKLLIPLALVATVLISAISSPERKAPVKPTPARSLQVHR